MTRRDFIGMGLATISSIKVESSPTRAIMGGRQLFQQWDNEWQNPYVTDGLIAMWDGEWNLGYGIHDNESDIWKDLVGGNDFTITTTDVRFGDNCICLPKVPRVAYAKMYDTAEIVSMEAVIALTKWDGLVLAQFASIRNQLGRWLGFRANGTVNFCNEGHYVQGGLQTDTIMSFSGVCHGNTRDAWQIYKNGLELPLSSNWGMTWGNDYAGQVSALNVVSSSLGESRIYNMRLYSRQLFPEEVAANYLVDRMRFGI